MARGGRGPEGPALLAASRAEYLTPLDQFGPSRHVYGRVHQADSGVYLLVAPRLVSGDPVFAVGWARNDYWAVQILALTVTATTTTATRLNRPQIPPRCEARAGLIP
jgi:hypothetical protein